MSVSSMIQRFGQDVTITRYGTGSNVNGDYVAGTPTTITAKMSVQPLNGVELQQLSEGQRTKNWAKAYSAVEVFTARQASSKKADLITDAAGTIYEVMDCTNWQEQNGNLDPHWKVRMAQVNT